MERTFIAIGILSGALCAPMASASDLELVGFDVPALVPTQTIDASTTELADDHSRLVRLKLPVTCFVSSQFRGAVDHWIVELVSPDQTMSVVDYWPRNEWFSEIEGNVAVSQTRNTDREFALTASASWEPIARGNAVAKQNTQSNVQETYQRRPPMQVLTSSGTIRRGSGVFFKFRPGQLDSLEGAREVALLLRVPHGWRADRLQVDLRAFGKRSKSDRSNQCLGQARHWVAIYQEGDATASVVARDFIHQELQLRRLAVARREQVQERSMPSMWHKIGAAIDVVDPKIPGDYLNRVIFGGQSQYLEGGIHRLPVDLRVAILDFWEARDRLSHLSNATGVRTMDVVSMN